MLSVATRILNLLLNTAQVVDFQEYYYSVQLVLFCALLAHHLEMHELNINNYFGKSWKLTYAHTL